MFVTWTFWIGAFWGGCCTAIGLWYWLIRPMGRALGWEKE